MENNYWHCSICNHIARSNRDLDVCPECSSPYIHPADNSCISISFREHGGKIVLPKETTTNTDYVPDATGFSGDEITYDSGAFVELPIEE